jgi:hypothetical protein
MRIYFTKCLIFSWIYLFVTTDNYWHLTSTLRVTIYQPILSNCWQWLSSQFRLLSEIFGFFRKHSPAFGNIRMLSETFPCFRKHSVAFGYIPLLSETFGCFRKRSDSFRRLLAAFGNIRVSGISVSVARNAVAYLPSLKRLQRSKTCRES